MEERMTEKSWEVEDIQEAENVQEEQNIPEDEEVQEELDERDDELQMLDEEQAENMQEEQNVPEDEEAQEAQDDESQMLGEEQAEIETEIPSTHAPTVESVVEAVLFASDESLTEARLANIVETSAKEVRRHIKSLNDKYEANNNAFRIEQIAGGYQMLTLSPYNHWLKKLLRARSDNKLSPAAMETLAIIAYKQPVMRADIEAIRGVAVGEVIRSLSYKGLVKIVGRAEVLGRPMLYGTTKKFLEVFGLNTLKDLPKVQELQEPSS
jgi:segregation and condensation protein B